MKHDSKIATNKNGKHDRNGLKATKKANNTKRNGNKVESQKQNAKTNQCKRIAIKSNYGCDGMQQNGCECCKSFMSTYTLHIPIPIHICK